MLKQIFLLVFILNSVCARTWETPKEDTLNKVDFPSFPEKRHPWDADYMTHSHENKIQTNNKLLDQENALEKRKLESGNTKEINEKSINYPPIIGSGLSSRSSTYPYSTAADNTPIVETADGNLFLRSRFHFGGLLTIDSASFSQETAENIKKRHSYLEGSYPLSLGGEIAYHQVYPYLFWDVGVFGQFDLAYKLSPKNTLDSSISFGVFGGIGFPIHLANNIHIIPMLEINMGGSLDNIDFRFGPMVCGVINNIYIKAGYLCGTINEKLNLKQEESNLVDSIEIRKGYFKFSLGYWK